MKPIQANQSVVVLLAGGKSERMGAIKALLPVGKQSILLTKILAAYRAFGAYTVVVLNAEYRAALQQAMPQPTAWIDALCLNPNPHLGKLYSLQLALQQLPDKQSVWLQPVDNPGVSLPLLQAMWLQRNTADWVSPRFDAQNGHPALLSPKVLQSLRSAAPDGNLKLLLQAFRRYCMPWSDGAILCNLNTPADYENYLRHRGR